MPNNDNSSHATISDEAYHALASLLRGSVMVRRPKTHNESALDENGNTKLNGEMLAVREEYVSIGRVLFSIYVLKELQMLGLVDEEGDVTSKARADYTLQGKAVPQERRAFVRAE